MTTATLSQGHVVVSPGSSASFDVTVHNDGIVVDSFTLTPLGVPEEWVRVEPPALSLFPGAAGTLSVTVSPPRRPDVLPTTAPFALRVVSSEQPAGSVVEEGVLEVLPFDAPAAELLPHTSHARGRHRGRHQVAVDNGGNAPLEVRVVGRDHGDRLDVTSDPPVLLVQPGEAALATVRPRARKGFWRGVDRTIPFTVVLESTTAAPLVLEATFLQQARVPRWLPKLLAALVALAMLAGLLWATVLKPSLDDQAQKAGAAAAKKEIAPLAAVLGAQGSGQQGGQQTTPPVVATPPAFVDPVLGNPASNRVQVGPGKQQVVTDFGAKNLFSLTDVVLSNPRGHAGTLTVLRDDDVLLQSDLANFRDLDYHFVSPLVFAPGQKLRVRVTDCVTPAPNQCEAAVLVSGYAKPAA
jgi:hypothetical protein